MSARQGLVRGALTYLRRDLREIVAPTSLPDDDGAKGEGGDDDDDINAGGVASCSSSSSSRLRGGRFAGRVRAVASGVREYCDSWKKPPASEEAEKAHEAISSSSSEDAAFREMQLKRNERTLSWTRRRNPTPSLFEKAENRKRLVSLAPPRFTAGTLSFSDSSPHCSKQKTRNSVYLCLFVCLKSEQKRMVGGAQGAGGSLFPPAPLLFPFSFISLKKILHLFVCALQEKKGKEREEDEAPGEKVSFSHPPHRPATRPTTTPLACYVRKSRHVVSLSCIVLILAFFL